MTFDHKIIVVFACLVLWGCGRETEKRTYQEITIESPLKTAWGGRGDPHASFRGSVPLQDPMKGPIPDELLDSKADVLLTWQKPENWQEYPGSGFRVVTFKAGEYDGAVETSIVSLSGPAGGIEANLLRWMTQINLTVPGDGLVDYLKKEGAYVSEGPVQLFDFTHVQKDAPRSTPSMYVSVIELPGSTIFVKMTGSIQAVLAYKEEFLSLSKSVKLKE